MRPTNAHLGINLTKLRKLWRKAGGLIVDTHKNPRLGGEEVWIHPITGERHRFNRRRKSAPGCLVDFARTLLDEPPKP